MQSLSFYLQNGAVDIVGTIAVVMVWVQITKPMLESFGTKMSGNPAWDTTNMHDSVIEVWTVLWSVVTVLFLTWAGPGFHSGTDVGAVVLEVVLAVASEFGIYAKVRGPVPATPTAAYLERVQTLLPIPGMAMAPPLVKAETKTKPPTP